MTVDRADEMRAFLDGAGWGGATLSPLPGDASTRRYLRVADGRRHAMLMDQPQNAETPAAPADATPTQRQALGYNAVARLAGADCARFVAVAEFLRDRGLTTPEIYAADAKHGFVLLEDLGDTLYSDVLAQDGDAQTLYGTAVDALAVLHAETAPSHLGRELPLHAYDETAMLAEIDLLTEWFMPLALGRAAQVAEIAEHRALWRDALSALPTYPPVFVHRDYHAQNLLWLPERTRALRTGILDFQDAVAGNKSYDLVSLLEDARRDVDPELALAMTERYLLAMRSLGLAFDRDAHHAEMAVTAAQRNAKIVGIFARLSKRDGKPRYLTYLPRVWGYLERDLAHPSLARLRTWYDRVIPHARRVASRYEGVLA